MVVKFSTPPPKKNDISRCQTQLVATSDLKRATWKMTSFKVTWDPGNCAKSTWKCPKIIWTFKMHMPTMFYSLVYHCSQFFGHAWGKVLCMRVPNSFFYMMTWWLTSRMLEVIKCEQGPEMAAPHFWSSNLFMIYLEHGCLLVFRVLKKIQKQRISKQKSSIGIRNCRSLKDNMVILVTFH